MNRCSQKKGVPNEVFEKYASKYFSDRRKKLKSYESDLDKLFVAIKHRPPLSVREVLCAVKAWLEKNEVELPNRFWKRLARRTRGSRALTRDRPPSKNEFKAILTHLDSKGRALFLLLEDEIEPYELTLKKMSKRERNEWATKVFEQVKRRLNLSKGDKAFFHTGKEYRGYLIPKLDELGVKCAVPLEGLSFGKQLEWYDKH